MTTITISLPDHIARSVDDATERGGFATRSEFFRNLIRSFMATEGVKLEKYDPISLKMVSSDLKKSGKYSQDFIDSVIGGLSQSSVYEK